MYPIRMQMLLCVDLHVILDITNQQRMSLDYIYSFHGSFFLSRISFGFFDDFAVQTDQRRLFANIPVFLYNSPSSFGDILRTLAGQMGPAFGNK